MNQKEAVFSAVVNVCGPVGDGAVLPTKEQRAQINLILFEGIRSGTIEMRTEKDDSDLRDYVSGLASNWLRKDKRLNGGVKHEAKNPGSRAGQGDDQLTALKGLKATLVDATQIAEVQTYIDARVAQLAAAKAKPIDFSVLPADLQAKFQK